MTADREHAIRRKNNKAIVKYLALYTDNVAKQKCMITFASSEKTYEAVNRIRKVFLEKMRSLLKNKYKSCSYAFFTVLEFGKDINQNLHPHIHIQCFYSCFAPLQKAFDYTIKKQNLDPLKCNCMVAENHNYQFNYVIKDFLSVNFDEEREILKSSFCKGKKSYWCSRKTLPDYVIIKMYNILSELKGWKDIEDKYSYILELIEKGYIVIKKITEIDIYEYSQYVIIKQWGYKLDINDIRLRCIHV